MHRLPAGLSFFERGWLSSNNVLIRDDTHAVLVDTGYWTHAHQTAALLADALPGKQLTHIVNTHLHSDHCGGNDFLQSRYPAVQTLIPPGHARFVDQWDAEALTYSPTGQHCPPFVKNGILSNGDCLPHFPAWRVYAALGHDPHSIILFHDEFRILISADALWENGFGVVFPEIEGIDAFDEVEQTLDIIENLKPELVLPGHGAMFTDVPAALVRARNRLAQFRNAPEKHALYAAKVLIKFKLLELQKMTFPELLVWARGCRYLDCLHVRYGAGESYPDWIHSLLIGLEKSHACELVGENEIVNI
jgi:glyoxylase-like metal-dependent hydrolase (beta-lactamase superfamily II)